MKTINIIHRRIPTTNNESEGPWWRRVWASLWPAMPLSEGDLPALEVRMASLEMLYIPGLKVLHPEGCVRANLAAVRRGQTTQWVVVKVAQAPSFLPDLPVVKLTERDVLSPDALPRFERKLNRVLDELEGSGQPTRTHPSLQ